MAFAALQQSPAGGPIATTPAAPATAYSPAYGGVPQVPSLIDVYGQTTAANQQFLPQFTQLGSEITAANQQQLLNNLRASIPGYDASVAQSMENIGSLQEGQIPTDVRNQITQQAAERGIATGLYDSPNANAALLSALGLTSLGLQGQGEQEMGALIGRTPQAQPFNIGQLLMNPSDVYQSQLLANIYGSAPQPAAAARQLIADQMGGYGVGRSNVPSYSTGAPTPVTPYTQTGNTIGGGGYPTSSPDQWAYDESLGAYYNTTTGQIADSPGGTPWEGFSWSGVNAPAQEVDESEVPSFYDF